MSEEKIRAAIRDVADFPRKGVQFKDITTALKEPALLREMIDLLTLHFVGAEIDYVAGIDARGFIFGAALAYQLGCGFIPVRKPGKLPAQTIAQEYALEYGTDKLEVHCDAVPSGARVLIVDDLIASGGTAQAAAKLLQKCGAEVVAFAFVIELSALGGRAQLEKIAEVYSLVQY